MRLLVVLAVVGLAVVSARPQDEECKWWEDCFVAPGDPTGALLGNGAVPKQSTGGNQGVNQNQGQTQAPTQAPTPAPAPHTRQSQGPTTYEQCNATHVCVPYYLCQDDGHVSTDGAGLFDIRLANQQCAKFLDICCKNPTTQQPTNPTYQPQCGVRNNNGVGVRITGFTNNQAQFAEFPWMAAVLRKEDIVPDKTVHLYVCGGSLIHPSVVLTAAHCVNNRDPASLTIRLGEWDTHSKTEPYLHQDVNVASIKVHENFHHQALFNDFALVFLSEPARLGANIDTICLSPNYSNQNCWATGWGTDRFGKEGEYQSVLKKIELNTWVNYDCQNSMRTTRLGQHFILDDSFICAGGLTGQDTCKGDGGSPLVCPVGNNRYVQAGIVAWGIGCGEKGIPGVYADVASAYDWIIQNTEAGLSRQGLSPNYQWF